ncbi:hypothetical protein GUG47_18535, partial [Xanthomonas citri pv. citri]|nr:hypothetical protein [Xanthomonas citri pv. citri]
TALAPVALVTAAVLPVVLLPGLAFARGGQWISSSYPNEYGAVAQRLSASSDAAAVLQRLAATGRSLGFHLILATQRAT